MIVPQEIYHPLYTDTEKFIILITGGRGSGKSFNASTFIERLTFEMTPEIGHVMDIMATCIDMAGATYPTKYKGNDIIPMEGKSLLPIFKNGHREGHDYLGFEHFNERAFLSNDGWKLVRPKDREQWELYNLNKDRSEKHNLAAQYPEKVAEMAKAYEAWAKRCMVEPYPGQKKQKKN